MNDDKREQTGVNNDGTGSDSGTRLTRDVPVMFEIVSYRGEIFGPYPTAQAAADAAREKWPHQHQDEETNRARMGHPSGRFGLAAREWRDARSERT